MVEKITDPQKVVTDPVLLSALAKQGIDSEYVEFYQDYASAYINGKKVKGQSPYAKFYRDLISCNRFMVVSGLPMVDADGIKIVAGWKVAGINYFAEKNNLFRAKVQGVDVELVIRNDQPDGRKANDRLSYKPQLFLDGIEQTCGQSLLLPVDPINSNYLENTLEWDYGICKRRLRIIEGSIHGSWVFPANPNGEVRIKYNQTGDYRLRLGQFATDKDTEIIPTSVFADAEYPFTVSDSATYYPDADPETSSVDGYTFRQNTSGETWSVIRGGAGTGASSAGTALQTFLRCDANTNLWDTLFRSILLFDTSALPDSATDISATLSVYGYLKYAQGGTPTINVYASNPASNTGLASGDHATIGSTAFATAITYANWLTDSPFWNNFTLNAQGIAAISLVDVSKFGLQEATFDVGGGDPTWTADLDKTGFYAYSSEKGNGYKPKLVVTYTVAGWTHIAKVNGVTASAVAKMSGVTIAAIAKVSGTAV